MKGTKTKVGKTSDGTKWRLRVFTGRDSEGRQHYETKTLVGTAREADDELALIVALNRPGGSLGSSRERTFAAAVELWRKHDAPRKSPPTARGYESNLALHVLDELGDAPVRKIHPRTLAALFDRLGASGLKPATVNNVHTAISAVLQRAVLAGWLDHNPARSIRRAPMEWRPPTAPERDELGLLLAAIGDLDDRALVLLAVATGARRGELCALRWTDLDLKRGRLAIERALVVDTKAGKALVEKDTKTHATRANVLPAYALDVLAARRARAEKYASSCKTQLDVDGFVFSDEPRGRTPWRPDYVSHRWMRARTRAGFPKVRFHDLRHFAVSEALANGADPVTVRDRVGHRSLDTTNLYAHARADADIELAARDHAGIGALLAK